MTDQRNSIGRHGSALGARTVLGVEALESRVLLAGLVNLSDNSLLSPSAQVGSDPAEVRQIDTQLTGASRVEIDEALSGKVDSPVFSESVWSPDRDWLSDSSEPRTEDETLGQNSCEQSAADHKKDCAKSDLVVNSGESHSSDSNVMPPATNDGASPLLVSKPTFIADVVTQSSTQENRTPLSPATTIAPSTFSPSAIPPLPFHYFTPSSQLNRGQDFNLHSQPLADAAVRETFVAISLLDASGVDQGLAKQTVIQDATSNSISNRTESVVSKHSDLTSDHPAMVHKGLAAIAQATEILRDADAIDVVHYSQEVLCDSWVDPSLISAIARTPSTLNRSLIKNPIASQVYNNRVQLGLFGLMSILLSLNSPIKLVGNAHVARGNGSRKSRLKLFCR